MSFEEKNTWVFAFLAPIGYTVYLVLLFSQLGGRPLAEAEYAWPMAGTILGAIVVGILGGIVVGISSGITSGKDAGKSDQRDKQINRFGDHIGSAFLVIGALGALLLAWFEAPHFWISNTLYLAFVLQAILSSIAKLVAYRRGLHQW
jgi:MFS family permease